MLCPLCPASWLPTYLVCCCRVYHGHRLCTSLFGLSPLHGRTQGTAARAKCAASTQAGVGTAIRLPTGPWVGALPRRMSHVAKGLSLSLAIPWSPGPHAWVSKLAPCGWKGWSISHTLHFLPWGVYISIIRHMFLFCLITRDIKRCILIYCLQKCTL